MDQKNKLLRQFTISLVVLRRIFLVLRALSFFMMLFLLSCLLFLFASFLRDMVSSMYSISLHCLTHTIGRSHMFFLCNGIFVFLAVTSTQSLPPPAEERDRDAADNMKQTITDKYEDADQQITLLPRLSEGKLDADEARQKAASLGTCSMHQVQHTGDEQGEEEMHTATTETVYYLELKNQQSVTQFDDQLTDAEDKEEELADEGDALCFLSTDELNRRCDDFIRKMREGIRTEHTSFAQYENISSY